MPENRGKGAGFPKDPNAKTVANDPEKRWRGGKGPEARIEERVNVCYGYILDGGTRRQVTQRLADRFNVSQRTADSDYSRAMVYLREEQTATREDLLNQIQAQRMSLVRKAAAKNHFQVAAMLLKDMGAVIGEAAPETLAISAPDLKISIEQPPSDA